MDTAMEWDETRFDLEYDLDQCDIVAVSDFNMGAMENKGFFNTEITHLDGRKFTNGNQFRKLFAWFFPALATPRSGALRALPTPILSMMNVLSTVLWGGSL